jgi:hypothetical protein
MIQDRQDVVYINDSCFNNLIENQEYTLTISSKASLLMTLKKSVLEKNETVPILNFVLQLTLLF